MRTAFINLFSVVLSFIAGPHVPEASVEFLGTTVELGGVPYYISPQPVSKLKVGTYAWKFARYNGLEFIPFSAVSINETGSLASTFSSWKVRDDVWSESFLTGLCTKDRSSIPSFIRSIYNIKFVFKSPATPLPSGPYFLYPLTGNVYRAYRLYTDDNQAFTYGVIPAGNGTYKQLSAHTDGAHTPTIGVPSRLYYTPTPAQPFAGLRLAVKDIFDVAGLKTGCGNRAYYQVFPEKNATAPAVQRLLDLGMVIVGKTKTSQFARAETSTGDWIDLHGPYNPRGDGYQDASSSSAGSGSALASYAWLDLALGSDTWGSMRGPAAVNGLYGNRPSRGAIPLTDVMPMSSVFDTGGIFSRDAILWAQVGKLWYTDFTDYTMYPRKLLFPVDVFGTSYRTNPPAKGSVEAILNTFVKKVEGFLGVTRTEVNFTTMWIETRPSTVTDPVDVLLNTTFSDIIGVDQVRLVRNPFFEKYASTYEGRTPFVNPSPSVLWAHGLTVSQSRYDEAIANKTIFQTWIASQVLRGNQPDTCSDSIMIYPQSVGTTVYRNLFKSPPIGYKGYSFSGLAVYAEVPDMVVPIGERAYISNITNIVEYLPVTMSFMAAKNCDLMLFNLISDMQKQGILAEVKTGSRMF